MEINNHKDEIFKTEGESDIEPLLDEMGSKEGNKFKQYVGALGVTLSAMGAGTTMAWTSPGFVIQGESSPITNFPVSSEEFRWVSACLAIGAMAACLPVGSLVDMLGRKRLMLLMVPFMVLGWAAIIYPRSMWMLYLGRILVGGVTGGFCIVTPMYVGEIAESSIRGILGSFFQLQITIGILLVYVLAAVTNVLWVSIISAIIPIIFFVLTIFLPESPRWLIAHDRREDARKALLFYRGDSYDVDKELNGIEAALEEERAQKTSCTQAFSTTAAKKALMLSLGTMLFQQFSGINAVIFYTTDIFKSAGSSMDPKIASIVVGVCQVIFTIVAGFIVDRLGRKILLFSSGLVMSITSVILGVYFYLKSNGTDVSGIGWLPLLCVNGFIILFSVGYGPIPWMYSAEIFSSQIKGQASSIATMVNWFSAFIITLFFSAVNEALGTYSTFWIFGAISALGCVFVLTMLLETKGKSLEQIQYELDPLASSNRNSQKTQFRPSRENQTLLHPITSA